MRTSVEDSSLWTFSRESPTHTFKHNTTRPRPQRLIPHVTHLQKRNTPVVYGSGATPTLTHAYTHTHTHNSRTENGPLTERYVWRKRNKLTEPFKRIANTLKERGTQISGKFFSMSCVSLCVFTSLQILVLLLNNIYQHCRDRTLTHT